LLLCTKKKRKGKERGGNAPFLAILRLPVAATPADELALTKADLTDADTSAIGIVTRSLDHLTTADEDSNVVDAASGRTEEDKITSLKTASAHTVGAVIILTLSIVDKGPASTLVDRVFSKTTAIEAHNVTIITIGADILLDTIGGTIIVTTTPAVRIAANHALSGIGNAGATVGLLGVDNKSD